MTGYLGRGASARGIWIKGGEVVHEDVAASTDRRVGSLQEVAGAHSLKEGWRIQARRADGRKDVIIVNDIRCTLRDAAPLNGPSSLKYFRKKRQGFANGRGAEDLESRKMGIT
jgi:hypothetical protein